MQGGPFRVEPKSQRCQLSGVESGYLEIEANLALASIEVHLAQGTDSDHHVSTAVAGISQYLFRHFQRQRRLVDTISQAAEELRQAELDPASVDPPKSPPVQLLHAHPLTVDVQRQSVVVKGRDLDCTVELTRSETALLALLVAQPGQVFSCR